MKLHKEYPWDVYLRGRQIDTVYYLASCDADYVKRSLINHDGYPQNIVLVRRG